MVMQRTANPLKSVQFRSRPRFFLRQHHFEQSEPRANLFPVLPEFLLGSVNKIYRNGNGNFFISKKRVSLMGYHITFDH